MIGGLTLEFGLWRLIVELGGWLSGGGFVVGVSLLVICAWRLCMSFGFWLLVLLFGD